MARRTLSIASAPGWNARFLSDDEEDGVRVVTLASWALVEESDGTTEIVGVIQRAATADAPNGRLDFADGVEGFQGYAFTGLATRAADV
jgi:hypothetical protein